ncbi:MAG: nitroreductase [Paraprevotella sp.]|nr:nitroreductase [Paraprevotella sp.]
MRIIKGFIFSLCACSALMATAACTSAAHKTEATADTTQVESKNAVIETIMSRRSIRKYKDQPVEHEKLQKIVECGINAPNAMNQQPWQVRVVDRADYINGLTEIYKKANPKAAEDPDFKNMFRNAPAVIFIASPKNGGGQLDCGLLGENIVLAAQSLGLGTCCLGSPVRFMTDNVEAAPYVERLQLPDDYALLYAIAVGYPDESPEAKPREMDKVKFIE